MPRILAACILDDNIIESIAKAASSSDEVAGDITTIESHPFINSNSVEQKLSHNNFDAIIINNESKLNEKAINSWRMANKDKQLCVVSPEKIISPEIRNAIRNNGIHLLEKEDAKINSVHTIYEINRLLNTPFPKEKTVIIGAGITGLLTALELINKHPNLHDITIVESTMEAAMGASFANGGALTPLESIPHSKLGNETKVDKPFPTGFRAVDPNDLSDKSKQWATKFKESCLGNNEYYNNRAEIIASLGLHSMDLWEQLSKDIPEIFQNTNFNYDKKEGLLRLHSNEFQLQTEFDAMKKLGVPVKILTREEILALNTGYHIHENTCGAIIQQGGSINPRIFCLNLQNYLEERGVKFQFNTNVSKLITSETKVTAIETSQGTIELDKIIACSGSHVDYLENAGINTGIEAVGGCSITITNVPHDKMPKTPIKVVAQHGVMPISSDPSQNQIRVGGLMFFGRTDVKTNETPAKEAIQELKKQADTFMPELKDNPITTWVGYRPTTFDGMMAVGKTKYENAFLNMGGNSGGSSYGPALAEMIISIMHNTPSKVTGVNPDAFNIERNNLDKHQREQAIARIKHIAGHLTPAATHAENLDSQNPRARL